MPFVRVAVHLPGITTSFVALDFLIDTGATDTCLHPQDAITKVGIPPASLARPRIWLNRRSTQGIGGVAHYYIQPATYAFRHEDGSWQQVQEEILIAEPTSTNNALPSLLGWNVLHHFEIHLDATAQRVTLDEPASSIHA